MGFFSRSMEHAFGRLYRDEEKPSLWIWGGRSNILNGVYTPYAITQLNNSFTIADYFKNIKPLKIDKAVFDTKEYEESDFQTEFEDSLKSWELEKADGENSIFDSEWSKILELVKSAIPPCLIYALEYSKCPRYSKLLGSRHVKVEPNNPQSREADINKNILLGLYKSGERQITLYTSEIRAAAKRYNISFELMAAKVLLHELGHFVMDNGGQYDNNKTAEESCANLIALLCIRRLVENGNVSKSDFNSIKHFIVDQPKEYILGPYLLEEHPWEWLKWTIKKKYDPKIWKRSLEECIKDVDNKPMFFYDKSSVEEEK